MAVSWSKQTGGGGGGNGITDYITLDNDEIAAQAVTLSQTPSTPEQVALDLIGGVPQDYGVDFTVSGNTLSWASLGMSSIAFTSGDVLRVNYNT